MTKRTVPIALVAALISAALCPTAALAEPPQETVAESKSKPRPLNIFEGRVLAPEDGKPVAGATVAVALADSGFISYNGDDSIFTYGPEEKVLLFFTKRNGRAAGTTKTRADGRFVIKGLKPGAYSVMVAHSEKGFAIQADIKQPNKGDPIELTLQAPATVKGSIKGLDFEDAWRSLAGRSDVPNVTFNVFPEIDDEGNFKAGPLPPVTWDFVVSRLVKNQGYSATLFKAEVETRPGKTAVLGIDLTTGEKFDGIVRGPKGKPLSGVSVVATTVAEPHLAVGAITDKSGEYALRGLPPGDYTLEAKRWILRTAPG